MRYAKHGGKDYPRRVVITGVGLVTPLGHSVDQLWERLLGGESSSRAMHEWDGHAMGLQTRLASPVLEFDIGRIERRHRRSMSRVAQFAYAAAADAIQDARLETGSITSPRMGVSFASTMGGTEAIREYTQKLQSGATALESVQSTTFLKIMSHTCAANLATAFAIPGRVIASCTACAAGTQSIGFGYEAIQHGYADRMLCGGAEELEINVVAVFDVLRSTSVRYNQTPELTPRPFDRDRDGIVVGEGAGALVLEEYEAALARGAHVYGEILGFHTNNDASHMTNPSAEGLRQCMLGALSDAGIPPEAVGFVNAHGTGTSVGDAAESRAIADVFGAGVPVNSWKGHFGHLMGACGAVETIASLRVLSSGIVPGTKNLNVPDPECGAVRLVTEGESARCEKGIMVKNSFAFGGINASLVIMRPGIN